MFNYFRRLLGLNRDTEGSLPEATLPKFPHRFSESSADLVKWITTNKSCPDCGSEQFLGGPEGGMSQNVLCGGCYAEFNFCLPYMVDRLAQPGGGRLHIYGLAPRPRSAPVETEAEAQEALGFKPN